mgnify:CR=1 FL=1
MIARSFYPRTVAILALVAALAVGLAFGLNSPTQVTAGADGGAGNVRIFMKFADVDGGAKDKDHKNWIDVTSFSHAIDATGRPANDKIENFRVIKDLDKSSVLLAEAADKRKIFSKVQLHVTKFFPDSGRVTLLRYELQHVRITSYSIGGIGWPTEQITFHGREIKMDYTDTDDKGKKKESFDVELTP